MHPCYVEWSSTSLPRTPPGRFFSVRQMASSPTQGLLMDHIARETPDVKRLAAFYEEVMGFERISSPNFGEFEVAWLRFPFSGGALSLHLIQRDPLSTPREKPCESLDRSPSALPRSHHVAFSILDFDAFVRRLEERGIQTSQRTQPDGKTRQVFFFDPDGNGLEVFSLEPSSG